MLHVLFDIIDIFVINVIVLKRWETRHQIVLLKQNGLLKENNNNNYKFNPENSPWDGSHSEITALTPPTQRFNPEQLVAIVRALQPILPQNRQLDQPKILSIKPYGRIIDTNTTQGSELYSQGIKRFDPLYGSQEHPHRYIDKVRQQAGNLNCMKIFNITTHNNLGIPSRKNIFDN